MKRRRATSPYGIAKQSAGDAFVAETTKRGRAPLMDSGELKRLIEREPTVRAEVDRRTEALARRLISATTISRVGGPLAIPDPVCKGGIKGAPCDRCHYCLVRIHGPDYPFAGSYPTAPPKGRR